MSPDPLKGDEAVTTANPFTEGSAEARLYDVIAQLQAPQPVTELATRSDCAPQTVREHLWSFVSLGIVVEYSHEPLTYARNDAYFVTEDG